MGKNRALKSTSMENISKLDTNLKPGFSGGKSASEKGGFLNVLARILTFLIITISVLLVRDALLADLRAPRTALERDIMDNTAKLQLNKRDASAHAGLGAAYVRMGRVREGIDSLAKAVELEPKSAKYRYGLAAAYRESGESAKALSQFAKARTLAPKWEAPLFARALIYAEQKKYDAAVKDFTDCLKLNPSNADAHVGLARVYRARRQNTEAISEYRQALRFVPDYAEAIKALRDLE